MRRSSASVGAGLFAGSRQALLQLDEELVEAFHQKGFEIAIETNGTKVPPEGIDWICVSPKAGADLILQKGNELKLVFPQLGAEPDLYEDVIGK